ncbi:MAG: methylated-DNA--[protein]-cysteine S-methyltransferase [Chloroflexota bacterium]|nr:methylated-DNA--[protein]-cysteine S-methyltransferase [Chloroflexota bacterium]
MASVEAGPLAIQTIATPVGDLTVVASAHGIREVRWGHESGDATRAEAAAIEHLERAVKQLGEYFRGERREFDLALDLEGTEFQRLVWSELARIPFGATNTYGAIAGEVGRPAAARAVGAATGRNPAPVIVPCHRVVGASGSLTGFAGGLDTKRALLAHEATVAGAGREGRLPGF